jgi:hypothetical protein
MMSLASILFDTRHGWDWDAYYDVGFCEHFGCMRYSSIPCYNFTDSTKGQSLFHLHIRV